MTLVELILTLLWEALLKIVELVLKLGELGRGIEPPVNRIVGWHVRMLCCILYLRVLCLPLSRSPSCLSSVPAALLWISVPFVNTEIRIES